ncbi:UNVERIFIED_CONTAM: hypothetical protein FKN15_039722 [Acipenser sinensis]
MTVTRGGGRLACSQGCRRGAAVIQQPPVSHDRDTGRSAFLDALDVREVLVGSEDQRRERSLLIERNRESGERRHSALCGLKNKKKPSG